MSRMVSGADLANVTPNLTGEIFPTIDDIADYILAHGQFALDVPGTVPRSVGDAMEDAVSSAWFGTNGNGVFNNTNALIAAFTWASANGRKLLVTAGNYRINNTVVWPITGDFEVYCEPGVVFTAAPGFPVDNKLFMPTTSSGTHRFKWVGGRIDGRNQPARVSGAPDLLYLSSPHLIPVHLEGIHFLNNNDRSGTAGDSGLFLAEGTDYTVVGCTFQGSTDTGIYISGDNAETVGRRCHVHDNTFIECLTGVISKRGFQDHTISDNFVNGVGSGIVVGGIGDIGTTGRKATITGNLIRRCGRGIESRVADGTVIVGNRIEDFGQDASGAPVADHAIRIAGSKRCVVASNVCILTGAYVPNAATSGVILERRTELAVDYDSTQNLVCGNVVHAAARGIVETTGSDQNQLSDNQLTSLTGARIVLVGTGSTYVDHDSVGKRIRTAFGLSGATPIAGSNTVVESNGAIIESKLSPDGTSYTLIVGDATANAVARMTYDHATDRWSWRAGGGGVNLAMGSNTMGFYGTTPVVKPTVTGSRGGNAALASLLTALAGQGLLTDSSTA